MYSWDEAQRNIAKHGVDFAAVEAFEWDTALIQRDERFDYGEVREIAFGFIGQRLYALVFNRRASVHLISLRKANRKEIARYVAAD